MGTREAASAPPAPPYTTEGQQKYTPLHLTHNAFCHLVDPSDTWVTPRGRGSGNSGNTQEDPGIKDIDYEKYLKSLILNQNKKADQIERNSENK